VLAGILIFAHFEGSPGLDFSRVISREWSLLRLFQPGDDLADERRLAAHIQVVLAHHRKLSSVCRCRRWRGKIFFVIIQER
jgi:hypothetical protein